MAKNEEWERRKAFAKEFIDQKCGILHLGWAIDAFWGAVTKQTLLPASIDIHAALVKGGYTENKAHYAHDDKVFFIPQEDKKVFVLSTQNHNYLFIFQENEFHPSFHIRKFWDEFNSNDKYEARRVKEVIENETSAINGAEQLTKYADSTSKYVDRPGLQYYKDIDFSIPSDKDKYVGKNKSLRRTYGDFRDRGYVLSYREYNFSVKGIDFPPPDVEGSRMSFLDLEYISTCYLPFVARSLSVKYNALNGYDRDK